MWVVVLPTSRPRKALWPYAPMISICEPVAAISAAMTSSALLALARTHLARKVTARPCWQQVVDGNWRPVLRRGKYSATIHKPDNSGLLSHLAQMDRSFRAQSKELRAELRSQTEMVGSVSGRRPRGP
jgi:hypothetical protein